MDTVCGPTKCHHVRICIKSVARPTVTNFWLYLKSTKIEMSNKRATLILVDSASRLILRINWLFLTFKTSSMLLKLNKIKSFNFFQAHVISDSLKEYRTSIYLLRESKKVKLFSYLRWHKKIWRVHLSNTWKVDIDDMGCHYEGYHFIRHIHYVFYF